MSEEKTPRADRIRSYLMENLSQLPPDIVQMWIQEQASPAHIKDLSASMVKRFGQEVMEIQVGQAARNGNNPNPFAGKGVKASEMKPNPAAAALWYGIYPGKVHLFIGETGAGKSSALLNIALSACLNEPLWGYEFGAGRPLKVIYLDPENSGGINYDRMERIGRGKPENLLFYDAQDVDLSSSYHIASLRELVLDEKADIVILDPIANLFGTENENDNSEAARQMKSVTSFSRATNCAVIAVHHTGKADNGSVYGRGAGARLAAADVAFILRSRGEEGEEVDDTYTGEPRQRNDEVRLQIGKDKPCQFGKSSLYLRMAGMDIFDVSSFGTWRTARKKSGGDRESAEEEAKREIQILLSDGNWGSRQDIQTSMKREGIGIAATDSALQALVVEGVLANRRKARGALEYSLLAVQTVDAQRVKLGQLGLDQLEDNARTDRDAETDLEAFEAYNNVPEEVEGWDK